MSRVIFLDGGDDDRGALSRRIARYLDALVARGARVVLRVDPARAGTWNEFLWTFDEGAFLPHGVFDGAWPPDEPVTIATGPVPDAASAVVLCVTDAPVEELARHETVFEVVDRCSPEGVTRSRARWAAWKEAGHAQEYRKEWT
ncbi:MAG: DNA polymerase III subunit chi [Deltaproteobacteria bacterium]|nr:DNA polymerase III subunit chi [Deltaproteobacteria bacterium]